MTTKNVLNDIPEGSSQEYAVRIQKINKMHQQGLNPWPSNRQITTTCDALIKNFNPTEPSSPCSIAGRLMTIREHGKSIFANMQDRTGQVQIYLKEDSIGEEAFKFFTEFVDIGDIIWVQGTSFKTKKGEITLQITAYALVSKCLRPLPDKFHGIADIEIKHRQRYLDLIMSKESRTRFMIRFKIIKALRSCLEKHGFLEVETPMLHPIPGGAAAKPFVTHHNALDMDLYLRIAPELFLKRLVVGGFERVYEINRCFRNEGVSTKHNPEFTSVEYYIAYQDYHFMMDLTEEMIKNALEEVHTEKQLYFQNYVLDFSKPFNRITMIDAVAQHISCSPQDLEGDKIDHFVKQKGIYLEKGNDTWGYKLYALFEKLVEPTLVQPTFITQFPVEVSPLSKRNVDNPALVDRFELFIATMEISNGFTELNDPFDQAERFREQANARSCGDEEAHYYDADFILALEYGLPPTVGAGIGIDRLVMLLTNTASIRDVILFPTLKHKDEHT